MNETSLKKIIEDQIDTFFYAGNVSIELRNKGLIKEIKPDGTPVSNGDLEINKIVTKKILELTPGLPIVSEETSHNKSTKNLSNFWLIDPIDGTYDYINNLNEFTINAGLILNKKPIAGLIYAPAKKRMFYSYGKDMSYELSDGKLIKLKCINKNKDDSIKFALPFSHADSSISYHCWSELPLGIDSCGIPAPINEPVLHPKDIKLLLVPALAVDYSGIRLGYGKGFYDKYEII